MSVAASLPRVHDARRQEWFWLDNVIVDEKIEMVPERRRADALAIYAILARLAKNETGVAEPGAAYLCKKTGRSKPTVIAAIKALEVIGAITVNRHRHREDRGQDANAYVLQEINSPEGEVQKVQRKQETPPEQTLSEPQEEQALNEAQEEQVPSEVQEEQVPSEAQEEQVPSEAQEEPTDESSGDPDPEEATEEKEVVRTPVGTPARTPVKSDYPPRKKRRRKGGPPLKLNPPPQGNSFYPKNTKAVEYSTHSLRSCGDDASDEISASPGTRARALVSEIHKAMKAKGYRLASGNEYGYQIGRTKEMFKMKPSPEEVAALPAEFVRLWEIEGKKGADAVQVLNEMRRQRNREEALRNGGKTPRNTPRKNVGESEATNGSTNERRSASKRTSGASERKEGYEWFYGETPVNVGESDVKKSEPDDDETRQRTIDRRRGKPDELSESGAEADSEATPSEFGTPQISTASLAELINGLTEVPESESQAEALQEKEMSA